MRKLRDVLIGPAGWSYADWRGRVYPERAGSKFDTLALVAKYFDVAEINSSFYYPPKPETARAWLERTAHNPTSCTKSSPTNENASSLTTNALFVKALIL